MYCGDKQRSKVNICHTLMERGWIIYGYSPDESDPYTDYYAPASWGGVAEKNGYVLCVDVSSWQVSSYSEREIFEYCRPEYSFKADAKIEQLHRLAGDMAATEGEKAAALEAIERIKARAAEQEEKAESEKKLICKYPKFQCNPPHCNWHIEKNGGIVAKGNGAFQFSSLPYWVDPITEQPKDTWRAWELDEDQKKDLAKFQSFIKRLESIAAMKIGEGEDPEYEMIAVKKKKREFHSHELIIPFEQGFRVNGYFRLNRSFACNRNKGTVYVIKSISNDYVWGERLNGKLNKVLTGISAANSIGCKKDCFQEWFEKGYLSFVDIRPEIVEVETQKCVRKHMAKEMTGDDARADDVISGLTYTVSEDVDTRDGSRIFLVKIAEKLSKELYAEVNQYMRRLGGYYSRFKKAFLFRSNPSEKLGV